MNKYYKISGVAYLIIFISGFYANFAVLESLIDQYSIEITTKNFIINHNKVLKGITAFFIMLISDLILVRSLLEVTKSTNKKISYVASLFRLLHVIFFGIGLSKLIKLYLVSIDSTNSFQLQNKVETLLTDFDFLWTIGLTFFGLHLIFLGYLILKSKDKPIEIGVLLLIAAIGYLIDGMAKIFMSSYDDYKNIFEIIVITPSVIGELIFTIWLILKGFKR